MHDDLRFGGRRRRQQFRRVPALRRRANAHTSLCLRAHREYGPRTVSGGRALQYRLRAGRHRREGGGRERRYRARRESAHVRERDRQEWSRALEAGDRRLREGGHRRQGHVPHRRRGNERADVANPRRAAARQRGIIFDVGHGGGSFDYTVAEPAIAQGCTPDTISSDIHVFSGNTPGMPYLPWVMSKFMGLGFTLEQVVAMATSNPAKVINRAAKLGTLQVGAPGDVAIMELVEGNVSFVDTRNNTRTGRAYLKPVQTVTAGVPFGRPYNSPFAVR